MTEKETSLLVFTNSRWGAIMTKRHLLVITNAVLVAVTLTACTSSIGDQSSAPSASVSSTQQPSTDAGQHTATAQPSDEPTKLPESTILEHSEIPTSEGAEGAEALFVFVMRERAAIFSGASAERLAEVSSERCAGCQSIIALDGAIDTDATNIDFPKDLEAQVEQTGDHYVIRGFGATDASQVTFLDGTVMRQKAMEYDVDMEATFRDGGWKVDSITIFSSQARQNELHGQTNNQ